MKIDTEAQADHQVKLTVELDEGALDGAKRRAARQIAKRVKIPGFRPGKAPFNVVERHVGEGAVLEDALDILLDEVYPKVIEEAGLDPYGPGSLEDFTTDDPTVLKITVPLAPEVELGDYHQLRIPYEEREVSQEDVDKVVDNLRERNASIDSVERPAQETDMVYIILNGERGDEAEGEDKALMKDRRFPVVVEKEDTDTKNEYPFPGFSRELIGLSAGDKKGLTFTYPEDYDDEDLRGAKAEFKVEVEDVKARGLPELNDEFAKSVDEEYETVDKLLEAVRSSLKESFDAEQEDKYDDQILEAVIGEATFKYPPQMVEHEFEHHMEDLQTRLKSQGLDLEAYLTSRELPDLEAYKEEVRPSIEERIQRSLAIMEVAKREGMEVSEEEVESKVEETLEQIRKIYPEEDARKIITDGYRQYLHSRITSDLTINQTLERLRALAKGEEPAEEAAPELVKEAEATEEVAAESDAQPEN